MKSRWILGLLVCGTMVGAGHTILAQRTAPPGAEAGVAILDVDYTFKKYDWFIAQMTALSKELEAEATQLKAEADQGQRMVEELKALKPDSADYKKLESDIALLESKFALKRSKAERGQADRESAIFLDAYKSMQAEVRSYCERNGIAIVLRFNGDPLDPSTVQTIAQGMRKSVLSEKGVDITPIVIAGLNRKRPMPKDARPAVTR